MKENPKNLLPGTVVKSKDGEIGVLIKMRKSKGVIYWLINWEKSGLCFISTGHVSTYELV